MELQVLQLGCVCCRMFTIRKSMRCSANLGHPRAPSGTQHDAGLVRCRTCLNLRQLMGHKATNADWQHVHRPYVLRLYQAAGSEAHHVCRRKAVVPI